MSLKAEKAKNTSETKLDVNGSKAFTNWVLRESHHRPVVVDFWATWCNPCKTLGPILEKLAKDGNGRWLLVKIDVDLNPEITQRYDVKGIPAVKAFVNGQVIEQFMGLLPPAKISAWLDTFVPSVADELALQAKQCEAKSDLAKARSIYQEILEQNPHHASANVGMARLELREGNIEAALQYLNRIAGTELGSLEQEVANLRLELQASSSQDLDALQARLGECEDDLETKIQIGVALASKRQHEQALELLLDVIRKNPSSQPAISEKARAAMVEIFDAIGFQSELTRHYRLLLAQELYR
jgi:putative thioredoxin